MTSPINKLMDTVDWKPIEGEVVPSDDNLPIATHQGILHIGPYELKVYQLDDGNRVIAEEDMFKFFEGLA